MMDANLLEKARTVMRRAIATSRDAEPSAEIRKGITIDDVLRIFPGARVLNDEDAQAPKSQQAEILGDALETSLVKLAFPGCRVIQEGAEARGLSDE